MSLVLPRHLTCRQIVELVTRYAEGGLDDDERARFEEHLATCGACVTYYDQMRLTASAVCRLDHDHDEPISPLVESALLAAFRSFPGGEG
jgi:anti-sigma factor RsiW